MDESSFTGELEPRHKYVRTLAVGSETFDHIDNVVYMGTLVRGGHGKVSILVKFFAKKLAGMRLISTCEKFPLL